MSREKSLAKNTMMLMIGKICTQCVSFFMLPLYTSVLATEEYGTADFIITYVSLLYPLVGMQFEQGLFRMMLDYRDNRDNCKQLLSTVILANVAQIILFTIIFLPICYFVHSEYIIYLLPMVVIQIIQGTLLQFSRGIGRTDIYTVGSFVNAVLHVGFNVLFIAILKIGLVGLFYSIIIAGIGSSAYIIIRLNFKTYLNIKSFSLSELKAIAKYSLPLIPNQLAWWVVNVSDRTVIMYFLGASANGLYTVANKFSSIYITFYNFFNMSWTESVSLAINDDDKVDYINKMINVFFNLIIAVCLVIIACMPFLFPILVNSAYKEAYYQVPILMIAVFFQALQGLYSAIYVAFKMTKEIAKTSIFAGVINILVNLLLIRYIGLYAASVSTLVAFFTMAIYRYFDIKRFIKISIKRSNIIFGSLFCMVVLFAYYSESVILCGIAFLIVIIYATVFNWNLLARLPGILKRIFAKVRK